MAIEQICTFHLAGQLYGIEVARVQEVLRPQRLAPVPLAPPTVGGLLNLRGEIVTALDLRVRLGLPPAPDPQMTIVVRVDGGVVSLLVDEIGTVVEIGAGTVEPPPETLVGPARDLVRAVCKLPDRLLMLLDTDRAVAVAAPAAA